MKRSGFRKLTYQEVIEKKKLADEKKKLKLKTEKPKSKKKGKDGQLLMPYRIKKAKEELVELSHTHVRRRDSIDEDKIGGYCFDCGEYAEGQQFQAGHFEADSVGGALLRYHPLNMHGQAGGCNMKQSQERVKINYTLKMIDMYGREFVDFLRSLKKKSIKADIIFYERMIELYKAGDEVAIINYLHNLAK